ncbi:ankyrin repeat domain-containing protein 26-like isoform X2 [Prionailurus viverrinus]|nr:ankyrin repeat domain-containing protein 26-like isoform X1 [Prionailurus viverrinus]XP_047704357.1 ankyrin repeat domain-containing protein 26-like isoform X1 [Prionailurus viverrinus]XP_047704360.1 ankyrin repeat domain-containing protein 26-like isoform X2 [Prionailurus viverrinus]
MASGAAAKRAQGERAAGRQPRPRPRPQRGADRVPPRLVPQRRTLDRGCCAPSRRRYRKFPVRNPSFQGLGRIDGGDKNAEEDSITRLSDKPGPGDSWPTSASQDVDFGTKEGTAKSAMEAKEDGVGIIENVPPEQTVNDSVTSAGGVHKNCRSDMMSALELGEEEDVESPSLPELQEAQDRHAEAIRHAEEMKDHMQK